MDSTILKEAIADAKAVRQTALANAKAALEEAFGSRLEAMFAPQLEEETADEMAGSPALGGAPGDSMGAVAAAPEEGAMYEADIAEIIRELESELPKDDMGAGGMGGMGAVPGAPVPPGPMGAAPIPPGVPTGADLNSPHIDIPIPPAAVVPGAGAPSPMGGGGPVPPAPVAPPPGPEGEPAAGGPPAPAAPEPEGEKKDEEMDEEIDIAELLESLKKEEEDDEEEMDENAQKPVKEQYEEEDDEEEMDENTLKEVTKLKSSEIGGHKAGGSDNKEPQKYAKSSAKEESGAGAVDSATVGTPGSKKTSSKDATVGAKRPNEGEHVTKDNLSTPNAPLKEDKMSDLGAPGGKTTSPGTDPTVGVDRPNEGEHVTKDKLDTPGGPLKEGDLPVLAKENANLRKQLREAEEGVGYLRKQLNEINLLNAKLLYTNKLFKNYSMNTDKKMKIVEMFDLAKNVREVKMTYTVIAESLNFGGDFKKKLTPKVQNITEGMASQAVAGTAPKQLITESAKSEMVLKFQRLAGIPSQKPQQPKK